MTRDRARKAALFRIYSRTVGVIQVVYALFFSWIAVINLRLVIQQEGTFKGVYFPPINLSHLCDGAIAIFLFLLAFVGGCGLLGLQRWARRWEVAYLVLVSILAATAAASEAWIGREVGSIGLLSMVLALPYVPFLFVSPPLQDEGCPTGVQFPT